MSIFSFCNIYHQSDHLSRLIKRLAVIAQLFYHTARILLAQAHPMTDDPRLGMEDLEQTHAYDICGIVANFKDRSTTNVSLRCLVIAAECLKTGEAQEEVLGLIDTIVKDTIWQAEPIKGGLKHAWGWQYSHPETVDPAQMHNHSYGLDPTLPIFKGSEFPSGIPNPLFNASDFTLDNHPYQGYYVVPHHVVDHYQYGPYYV